MSAAAKRLAAGRAAHAEKILRRSDGDIASKARSIERMCSRSIKSEMRARMRALERATETAKAAALEARVRVEQTLERYRTDTSARRLSEVLTLLERASYEIHLTTERAESRMDAASFAVATGDAEAASKHILEARIAVGAIRKTFLLAMIGQERAD